jgi:hypothetical protein
MNIKLALLLLLSGCAFSQSTGTFSATGSMITPRFGHTATLLTNGKVLICGGGGFGGGSAELYDPSSGTFARTGEMITPRSWHAATLLADGKVLITGGSGIGSIQSTSAELYDPSAGTFSSTRNTIALGGIGALLRTGKVLVASALIAQIYDPDSRSFDPAGKYAGPDDIGVWAAVPLADGRALIAGNVFGSYAERTEIFDPLTDSFSLTGSSFRGALESPATALLHGIVLFAGGDDSNTASGYATAETYNPFTGTFSPTGTMTTSRFDHTQTLLPDGTVLIAGSQRSGSDGGSALASAETYDPSDGTFAATGSMLSPRFDHTATLLPDGTVLIAGGTANANGGSPGARAEIYHPAILISAPVLFALSGGGQQGAIWHATSGEIASSANPAIAGEILSMYTVNLADASAIPPQVAVGGRLAEILYFGPAPGYAGYYQVNFRVPGGVGPGQAVPVRLTYIGRPSNAVTIGLN